MLELGTDHAGLLTLSGEPTPGTPLPDILPTDGWIFVLEGNPEMEEIVRVLAAPGGEGA